MCILAYNKVSFILHLFFLVSLVGCEKSDCDAFTVTFNGTVVDGSAIPIDGVDVLISVNGSDASNFTTTDANGNFSRNWFRGAPLREVILTFSKTGYQSFSTEPRDVGLNCSDEVIETNPTLNP